MDLNRLRAQKKFKNCSKISNPFIIAFFSSLFYAAREQAHTKTTFETLNLIKSIQQSLPTELGVILATTLGDAVVTEALGEINAKLRFYL